MKRKLFTLVLAAFVSVVSFTACSKSADKPATNVGGNGGNNNDDDDDNNNSGDNGGSLKNKLVGSYKMTKLTLVQDGGTTDILAQYKSCDKDNLYVLKADMTSLVEDAGEQCSPSSNNSGTWSLPDDNTIVMDGQAYHIESLSGNTLKMSVEIDQDGTEATLEMTYVKQ